jgi:hypothetical protein
MGTDATERWTLTEFRRWRNRLSSGSRRGFLSLTTGISIFQAMARQHREYAPPRGANGARYDIAGVVPRQAPVQAQEIHDQQYGVLVVNRTKRAVAGSRTASIGAVGEIFWIAIIALNTKHSNHAIKMTRMSFWQARGTIGDTPCKVKQGRLTLLNRLALRLLSPLY